jgi:DnaJ-class molecular chaperone
MDLLVAGKQTEEDYYAILGVDPNANTEEIKRAYCRMAFQYHPDRHQNSEEAHSKMKQLNEVCAVLTDPIRRREYDIPRGYGIRVPKFRKGNKVKISMNSPSSYRGYTGSVDEEPTKDNFRFWYRVRIEARGLTNVGRFAEEELEKTGD